MGTEAIDSGDGQVSPLLEEQPFITDHTDKTQNDLSKILDVYISVYKGEPWEQDLTSQKEEIRKNWIDNNVFIQPLKNKSEIVGFHIWKNGKWEDMKDLFIEECQSVLSYPVGDATTDISNIDFDQLKDEITKEVPEEAQIFYPIDMGTLESQRNSPKTKLQMLISLVNQLKENDYLIAQTLNQGPLFEILKELEDFRILKEIETSDPQKRHIIFMLKCEEVLKESNFTKLVSDKNSRFAKIVKMSTPINAGDTQNNN